MKYQVTLAGKVYEVEVEHGEAILVDVADVAVAAPVVAAPVAVAAAPAAAPVAAVATAAGEAVSAPMPGTILKVNVQNGQAVKKGALLLVLEAMKMENEIMSPRDGSVAQVVASKGQSVNTGDALIVLA